jgi:hypothetical protein
MYRIGFAVLGCLLMACNGTGDQQDKTTAEENSSGPSIGNRFHAVSLPYQLPDTVLLNNKDTATLPATTLASLVPDTLEQKIFGKTKSIRYTPLAKIENSGKEGYYVVKGSGGGKVAALLMVFDDSGNYGATVPFLVPDNNAATAQVSSIDQSYVITKSVAQRSGGTVTAEGKEVLAWDAKEKNFSLIMTDLLHDDPAILVNPLDTFAKTNRLAGDYYENDKNLVAVRDGRHANQILVYIHTENADRDCIGEVKGEFILTSTTTAVYRQGGDPCVLSLTFSGNSVSLNEERGCGNHRGRDCPFSSTFTRKKEGKSKETPKRGKNK